LQVAEIAARETLSPVERLEIALHPWVGFVIMPLFAFANAGVPLPFASLGHSVTLAVLIGFTIGKPIGILTFSWLAVCTGIARRPSDLDWRLLAGGGLLAGIGFTMTLFIANPVLDQSLIDSAKSGIFLASVVAAVAGFAILKMLTGRRAWPIIPASLALSVAYYTQTAAARSPQTGILLIPWPDTASVFQLAAQCRS
jgi:Na+:H+ antiporter, NhaA family